MDRYLVPIVILWHCLCYRMLQGQVTALYVLQVNSIEKIGKCLLIFIVLMCPTRIKYKNYFVVFVISYTLIMLFPFITEIEFQIYLNCYFTIWGSIGIWLVLKNFFDEKIEFNSRFFSVLFLGLRKR